MPTKTLRMTHSESNEALLESGNLNIPPVQRHLHRLFIASAGVGLGNGTGNVVGKVGVF